MELIHGRTLRAWAPRASLAERLRALVTTARALAAAHARGVVHRDVKPDNVMMRDDGVLKVLDFGIARRVPFSLDPNGPTGDLARRTLSSGIVGTPGYMAPEQLRGEGVDGRSDQFAWGVMAFEVLEGTHPWADASDIRTVASILAAPAPSLTKATPEVAAVVRRALAKDARARYARMTDVADALEAALGREAPRPARAAGHAWTAFAPLGLATALMLGAAFTGPPHARATAMASGARSAARPAAAIEAFEEARRDLREASLYEARRELGEAVAIDPTFAAAHLWTAILSEDADDAMHDALAHAVKYRSSLAPKEVALLEAVGPWARVPVDWVAAEQRLVDAARAFPRDVEMAFVLGLTRLRRNDYAGAIVAFTDAEARDAGFAAAVFERGVVHVARGDVREADAAFRACLDEAPGSTSCLRELALDAESAGRCAEEADIARRLAAREPETPEWNILLAQALLTDDVRGAEAAQALDAAVRRMTPDARATERLRQRTTLDILRGELDAAERDAAAWELAVEPRPDALAHLLPARTRMLVALEVGDTGAAGRLAKRYLARQSAWVTSEDRWGTDIDALGVAYRAGALGRAAFVAERDAWLAREEARAARAGQLRRGLFWIVAFAAPAVTAEDARNALAMLPRFAPLPSAIDVGLAGAAPIGETYRLSGRNADAAEWLVSAARSCVPIDYPLLWVQAKVSHGRLAEEQGDRESACTDYGRVLDLWGRAPRSVTAGVARARAAALGCARR
jgi:serine/threonine-protein kinase